MPTPFHKDIPYLPFSPDAVQFCLYGIQSITRSRYCFSTIISCGLQNISPKTLFFPVSKPYFYKTYIFWSNLIHNHPLIYSPSSGCRCITSQRGSIRHQQTIHHPQSDLQEYFGIRPNTHIPGRGIRLPNAWKEISYELFQEYLLLWSLCGQDRRALCWLIHQDLCPDGGADPSFPWKEIMYMHPIVKTAIASFAAACANGTDFLNDTAVKQCFR